MPSCTEAKVLLVLTSFSSKQLLFPFFQVIKSVAWYQSLLFQQCFRNISSKQLSAFFLDLPLRQVYLFYKFAAGIHMNTYGIHMD